MKIYCGSFGFLDIKMTGRAVVLGISVDIKEMLQRGLKDVGDEVDNNLGGF